MIVGLTSPVTSRPARWRLACSPLCPAAAVAAALLVVSYLYTHSPVPGRVIVGSPGAAREHKHPLFSGRLLATVGILNSRTTDHRRLPRAFKTAPDKIFSSLAYLSTTPSLSASQHKSDLSTASSLHIPWRHGKKKGTEGAVTSPAGPSVSHPASASLLRGKQKSSSCLFRPKTPQPGTK